jgi:hypothetical protein
MGPARGLRAAAQLRRQAVNVMPASALAWPGLAWPGLAWPGLAWPGPSVGLHLTAGCSAANNGDAGEEDCRDAL